MATRTLLRQVHRLESLARARRDLDDPLLALLRDDPAQMMTAAGMTPDPWQAQVMRCSSRRILLLCSRQSGKSTTAAALALRTALLQPHSLVLILSRALRQSGEFFRDKLLRLYTALGQPVPPRRQTALTLELANGARVISLPGAGDTIVGYSGVALLIIDEAARVPDPLYRIVRPMLAVSGGTLVALSTPFGKRGWFHDEWHGPGPWERVRITADECPRIAREFLEEERCSLGERWYRQEYECSFEDAVDSVFAYADVAAALSDDVRPLFEG